MASARWWRHAVVPSSARDQAASFNQGKVGNDILFRFEEDLTMRGCTELSVRFEQRNRLPDGGEETLGRALAFSSAPDPNGFHTVRRPCDIGTTVVCRKCDMGRLLIFRG
jgi:hypothetical protein